MLAAFGTEQLHSLGACRLEPGARTEDAESLVLPNTPVSSPPINDYMMAGFFGDPLATQLPIVWSHSRNQRG